MIRMVSVDPMHTFLLGMVKRETELNMGNLSPENKKEFIRRVKLPYNIGRLPINMFDKEGNSMSGPSADQWKIYATIFARPCLYKLLPNRAYKSLVLLCRIVSLVSSDSFIKRMESGLLQSITIIMSLHIPEIIMDLGPPHSLHYFSLWC